MKIQFIPGIDAQPQKILKNDLAAYESRFDLTDEEHRSLYEWVSEGNAVCDNPWYMWTLRFPSIGSCWHW